MDISQIILDLVNQTENQYVSNSKQTVLKSFATHGPELPSWMCNLLYISNEESSQLLTGNYGFLTHYVAFGSITAINQATAECIYQNTAVSREVSQHIFQFFRADSLCNFH